MIKLDVVGSVINPCSGSSLLAASVVGCGMAISPKVDDPRGMDSTLPVYTEADKLPHDESMRRIRSFYSQRPGVEHYRRVYESLGEPWPGDDEVVRRYGIGKVALD